MQNNKPLRQTMPTVAAWFDELCAAFGAETIRAAVRAGLDGQPTFYAQENGQEIGTRAPYREENSVPLSDIHLGPINATAAQRDSRQGKN